jgi:hypothetical protein
MCLPLSDGEWRGSSLLTSWHSLTHSLTWLLHSLDALLTHSFTRVSCEYLWLSLLYVHVVKTEQWGGYVRCFKWDAELVSVF